MVAIFCHTTISEATTNTGTFTIQYVDDVHCSYLGVSGYNLKKFLKFLV